MCAEALNDSYLRLCALTSHTHTLSQTGSTDFQRSYYITHAFPANEWSASGVSLQLREWFMRMVCKSMTLCSLNAAIKFPKLPFVISSAAGPQRWFLKPNMLFYLPVRDDGADLQQRTSLSPTEVIAVAEKNKDH